MRICAVMLANADAARTPTGSRRKLFVTLAALFASLLLLELALRARAYVLNRETLAAAFASVPETAASARVRFRDIIQPNANDRIIFELRPNLDVFYKGAQLTTNSLGFRGGETARDAAPGTITIVGLGGSHMFGHGVADEDCYTVQLERLLRERHPERGWRVINTGVPTYGVVTKVEVLKEKGLAFEPDLVLLDVDRNNLDLPSYVRVEENPLALDRSFLFGFLRELEGRRRETDKRYAELAYVNNDQKRDWATRVKADPETVPERFRALLGWEPFYAAMDELARLGREHDFEVMTFAYLDLDINARLIEEAAKRGFHALSFMDRVEEHLRREYGEGFSVERYIHSDLVVSEANLHPSVLLHRFTAEWLLEELESRGVIERLLAKP
jgi:hypothetical protein